MSYGRFDDKIDDYMELLCTCETYWECDWHRRLRIRDVTRHELEQEMEDVITISHGVYCGVFDPEPGWELIKGRRGHYWRPTSWDQW